MKPKMGFQIRLLWFLGFFFCQIFCSCEEEQLGWRQSISRSSPGRTHGNKPHYPDRASADKLLLRFSVHFCPEEDFREEYGRGDGGLNGTQQH